MTAAPSPFDPPVEQHDSHVVLRADDGALSLWPVWRETPPGWCTVFGPAAHGRCLRRIGADRP